MSLLTIHSRKSQVTVEYDFHPPKEVGTGWLARSCAAVNDSSRIYTHFLAQGYPPSTRLPSDRHYDIMRKFVSRDVYKTYFLPGVCNTGKGQLTHSRPGFAVTLLR